MIHTQVLEHACKLAIFSAFVKGERPVSLMLLAPPEHAKSEILKKFAFIPSVKIMTDFNTFLFQDFCADYERGLARTLIFPDFLRVIKKKYATQANVLSILNSITEEGWLGKLPLGQSISRPIVANVLTGLTREEIKDKRYKWAHTGFMSRFVPLSYSYRSTTKDTIRAYIRDRIYQSEKYYEFEVPDESYEIVLPSQIAEAIQDITVSISEKLNIYGFRLQRQLQVLAMASALSSYRSMVNWDDFKTVEMISAFVNFGFSEI